MTQEEAQKKMEEARAGVHVPSKPPRQEQAIVGVLAVWLAARAGGATVPEMVDYLRSLQPTCSEGLVLHVLKTNPAVFGSLGAAGKLWAFKAYDKV